MGRDLQGRVAIITGPGRGIGLGIVKKLSEKEASIVIFDVNEDSARSGVAEMEAMGGKTIYTLADVSKYEDAQNLVDATIREVGSLDILVNNAGVSKDRMFHKTSADDWNAVIAVNLTGVPNCTRVAISYIKEREYGRIINTSSASCLNGNINQANYAAAKAGVVALIKTCAEESGRENITRNATIPGFIDTEMTRGAPEKAWDVMVGKISVGHVGTPEGIGNMTTFSASDEVPRIIQGVFEVDGGMVP